MLQLRQVESIRCSVLQAGMLGLLLLVPVMAQSELAGEVLTVLYALALFGGVVATSDSARGQLLAALLLAAGLAGDWLGLRGGDGGWTLLAALPLFAALVLVFCLVLRHVLRERTVTLDTIVGATCGYLLLAAIYAETYGLIERLAPGSFLEQGHPLRASGAGDAAYGHLVEFLYFSLVTLTTLGYGDITPATPLARVVSGGQALLGQLYPAVLIAHVVGLRLAQVQSASPPTPSVTEKIGR